MNHDIPARRGDDGANAEHEQPPNTIQRRGLMAAAWAAVAGLVLRQTTQTVEAAGPVQYSDAPNTQFQYFVSSPQFFGAQLNLPTSSWGNHVLTIHGQTTPTSDGIHVNADGGTALFAESLRNSAVFGQVPGSSAANTICIYGVNNSTYAGPGPGAGGFAIYGLSAKGHGLVGATAAAGAAAVVGATNGVAGAYAGAFYGPVIVGGNFTVVGGAKSAAVPHPDGSHRLLYCLESPESWFEDFGTGALDCGSSEIALDADFAAVADTSNYHVFLTQYDEHNDLCVTGRTPRGFTVRAKDAAGRGAFSWRVVAKRKDIDAGRLAPVSFPPAPELPPAPRVNPGSAPQPEDTTSGVRQAPNR
jgi:hypothetical protein